MYKIIGNRVTKEKEIETDKQQARIVTHVCFVDNPNDEELIIGEIPTKPEETATHEPLLTLEKGVLSYKLIKKSKPLESRVKDLEKDIDDVAEMVAVTSLDKDELAEMLVYSLQRIDELEGIING